MGHNCATVLVQTWVTELTGSHQVPYVDTAAEGTAVVGYKVGDLSKLTLHLEVQVSNVIGKFVYPANLTCC